MKLLRITASGLPLFKKTVTMPFYARQRVAQDDKAILYRMSRNSKYYLNCANAIIGINASGKTSALKVILLALDIVNNEPLNHSETKDILSDAPDAVFTIDFLSDADEVCRLVSHISAGKKGTERVYRITDEKLYVKPLSSVVTKKTLLHFDSIEPYSVRTHNEEFLPDDVSIIIAFNKQRGQHITVASMLSLTNVNVLPVSTEIPKEVVQFLDPTVEHLFFHRQEDKVSIHLKFRGEKEIILSDPAELNQYLSSGTIKGIVVFTFAIQILKEGGYLILDEIENHFNEEIAVSLVRFFMDMVMNIYGGSIIFTTHYPELLDEFERNDSIFITRNRDGIEVDNLMDILKRNDLKKSDVYQSGILEGTVPAYDAYIKLKKNIQASLKEEA